MFGFDERLARLGAAIDEFIAEELDASPAPLQSELLLGLLEQRDRPDAEVGRRSRVVSKAQRRALVHRDRHCAFPGCRRPPRACDAHNLQAWHHGGPTDLGNLVLLCRRHHVLCHEGGWQLSRCPDGTITATPPNHGPPRPRGPDLTLVA